MSLTFNDLFGLGLIVAMLLAVAARVLMLLFWRRVRHVNRALWDARNRAVWADAFNKPISQYRTFWTTKWLLSSRWKSDWEAEYGGSLDDRMLDRLVSVTKSVLVVCLTLMLVLFWLAIAAQVRSKF